VWSIHILPRRPHAKAARKRQGPKLTRETLPGAIMDAVRLIAAPVRRIANSRVFQLAVVIAIILLLDHYSFDYAVLRPIADGLKDLVTETIQLCSRYFRVGILTDPVLQVGLMIAYVYAICLFAFFLLRSAIAFIIDLIGSSNFLWLRSAIARERGIAAYLAWLPLERIRPRDISQDRWEETYAWPADDKPPYPPLHRRITRALLTYVVVFGVVAILIQLLTPFPVLTWSRRLISF
jgi:hypothetical protein